MKQKQHQSTVRIVYLDLLRIIATFSVIFLHVSSEMFLFAPTLSKEWTVVAVCNSLVRWCIPVFVMISGAVFLNPNREMTYREILTKRIVRLLVAYVFWSFAYALFGFAMAGFEHFTIPRLIRRTISSHFHLWFLPMLMGVYLLIPLLRKIVQDKKLMRYSLVIWMIYIGVGFLLLLVNDESLRFFYPVFAINTVLGFSGFFVLGYYLYLSEWSKKQKCLVYVVGIIGALITIAGTLYLSLRNQAVNDCFFSYLSLHVAAMATALFVLVKDNVTPGKRITRCVEFTRKDLFGVYLIHVLWIQVINLTGFRQCCNNIITMLLITLIVFVLSLFTTKLIRLIPVLRKVVK